MSPSLPLIQDIRPTKYIFKYVLGRADTLKEHGFFEVGDSADNNEISRLHDVSLEMTLDKLVKHLNIQDEGQVEVLEE